MGLTSWRGDKVKRVDVTVAKNYLKRNELEMLNLLVDQYLSFAELQARQRKPMYMRDWERKLNEFLRLNEREILRAAGKISAKVSEEVAHTLSSRSTRQSTTVQQSRLPFLNSKRR